MKFKEYFSQIAHIFVGAMLAASVNAQTAITQKYDFNYRVSDERISVFDDGKVTRIQLPEGMTIPIVMSQEPAGDVLLELKKESPYLSIQGTYSKLVMRWSGKREVVASYNGAIEIERLGRPAAFGMATQARTYGAVSEPVEFEKIQIAVETNEKAPVIATAEKQKSQIVGRAFNEVATANNVINSDPHFQKSPLTVQTNEKTLVVAAEDKQKIDSTLQEAKDVIKPVLVIRAGERLMPTLKKWLADQNIELIWAANSSTAGRVRDVVFEDDFESSASDVNVALTEVLSSFALEAEISTSASMRRVTVRNLRTNL
jgi:hypothetical protein